MLTVPVLVVATFVALVVVATSVARGFFVGSSLVAWLVLSVARLGVALLLVAWLTVVVVAGSLVAGLVLVEALAA